MEHPYIKYAKALLVEINRLTGLEDITENLIKQELQREMEYFSLKPLGNFEGKEKVHFGYSREKNDAKNFFYLAPNVISTEMRASKLYDLLQKLKSEKLNLSASCKIPQSAMPIAGEFSAFSEKGNISRGKPSSTIYNECLAALTSLTHLKPCLQSKKENVCIIPDLEIKELMDFIRLFKILSTKNMESDILNGKVVKNMKGKKGKITYTPKRPNIFKGNFPNPPRSSALCSIALLGTIGEMIKDSETSPLAKQVIKSLENANIYMVKYGDASVFTYNHYIIRLASEGSLRQIVDSIYWCTLYNYGDREKDEPGETEKEKNEKETAYETFDLFAGRFLQLFNRPAFKDFLAFRATYPSALRLLLTTYFEDMEKIDGKVVNSAKEFGRWLNTVAYRAAKKALTDEGKSGDEERRKVKAKFLVELESSALAAKTGDALIAQIITRAGRLSNSDASFAASLFMEQAMSGELEVGKARNLLIAFLRLRQNKEESAEQFADNSGQASEQETDYSNI
ncbi:type I-PGING CRISPR-associated protein Cas8c/Csp2 [Prevotella sp. A2931]|uniref:Type I-PGING CRISPR-associated protein Cas8c/Csp2 n=1 Tax=Prevotella illustrans TaxID=2800387 RepID=A0ABS3M8J9_9BACT|nr:MULTISPECIES: type I-PGING CRISPR-associated protein Cas8c/Csp2 [Prevotella]MBO1364473.1 type I-PGING CRISPR-associated protein Cas8c/Csp2 [Prevotella illustrans]